MTNYLNQLAKYCNVQTNHFYYVNTPSSQPLTIFISRPTRVSTWVRESGSQTSSVAMQLNKPYNDLQTKHDPSTWPFYMRTIEMIYFYISIFSPSHTVQSLNCCMSKNLLNKFNMNMFNKTKYANQRKQFVDECNANLKIYVD
jgi:hypothetical protein